MENKALYNELAILNQIAAGDEKAFALMMDHYTPVIYPYLLYWLKNASLVQEVTQDIYIRLWNNRQKLPELHNFFGYLYTIARNRASTVISAELTRGSNEVDETLENLLPQSPENMELKELSDTINAAIETLPPKRKEVFKLSRQEDLTYEEIAEKLQISRNTVKGHMVSALVYLRTYLKTHSDMVISWVLCLLGL